MRLAYRNLNQSKTRLVLSVAGVALAVMLILILNGFLDGLYRQITSYLDHSPGALVVAQDEVVNLLGVTSLLPEGTAAQVEWLPGVDAVVPILSQFTILDLHEKKQPAYLIGYDPGQGGGPWKLAAGREPRTERELVFDSILAGRHALQIGDAVEVLGEDFTIVGLSDGTSSWMTSYFFIQKGAAEELFRAPGATSFLLVRLEGGAALDTVLVQLDELPGAHGLTKAEVAENDLALFARVFSTPLKLMVAIAFLVGTLVVGLVIYTLTVERQREYGTLKAIGGTNRVLYQVVLTQALFVALAGSTTGVLLAIGLSRWIMAARPQFLIVFDPVDAGGALLAGLAMALAAAIFPARVVAGLAPAEVFRR